MVHIALYVDKCLMVGNRDAIKDAVDGTGANILLLAIEGTLEDHLSCEILFNEARIFWRKLKRSLNRWSKVYRPAGHPVLRAKESKDREKTILCYQRKNRSAR